MNNLPKVVTQRCLQKYLNPRPTDSKSSALPVALPRHLALPPYASKFVSERLHSQKAKFHYASWFGAGSEPVRSWFELKFGLSSSLLAAN